MKMQDLAELVDRTPALDKNGKFTGPTWWDAQKVYDEILKGGRETVVKLIGMLRDVDNGDDYKVRYVLHGLALYCCRPEKEKDRVLLAETFASQIGGDRAKSIQGFLVRELQVMGGKESVEPLGKLLLDDELWEYAAQALLAIREGAVGQFRSALPKAKGKFQLTIVQALGVLKDAGSAAAFKAAAGDADTSIRLAGIWALAHIGEASAVDALMVAAETKEPYARIKATNACLILAENLVASGRKADAARLYTYLRDSRADEKERYVREAAERGLATTR